MAISQDPWVSGSGCQSTKRAWKRNTTLLGVTIIILTHEEALFSFVEHFQATRMLLCETSYIWTIASTKSWATTELPFSAGQRHFPLLKMFFFFFFQVLQYAPQLMLQRKVDSADQSPAGLFVIYDLTSCFPWLELCLVWTSSLS